MGFILKVDAGKDSSPSHILVICCVGGFLADVACARGKEMSFHCVQIQRDMHSVLSPVLWQPAEACPVQSETSVLVVSVLCSINSALNVFKGYFSVKLF